MADQESKARSGRVIDDDSQTGRAIVNLREMIMRGEFRAGERLSELPLVARLGVSRTPLRLALDRLANWGLLDLVPTGGFMVREFSIDDIWDTIETRGVLEGTAARLAAERLKGREELETLRVYCDELEAIADLTVETFPQYLKLNEAFHERIVDLAKSRLLKRTLDSVLKLPFAAPSALILARTKLPKAAEEFTIAMSQHRALIEAIEHREGTRAESIAREHARLSRHNLELALSDPEILNCLPGASLIRDVAVTV